RGRTDAEGVPHAAADARYGLIRGGCGPDPVDNRHEPSVAAVDAAAGVASPGGTAQHRHVPLGGAGGGPVAPAQGTDELDHRPAGPCVVRARQGPAPIAATGTVAG